MPEALVLGGATGLLGQALMKELPGRGWKTVALGRGDGDLFDEKFMADVLETINPDVIFNTVAWTQVDAAEDNEEGARNVNRNFPAMLAGLLLRKHRGHLIHFSTDFVFSGQPPKDYWRETDSPAPTSVYGRTKLEGEQAVMQILPDRSCVIRAAWLFGPGRKNFVSTILDACAKNSFLSVVDDQIGSPTYSPDLAAWSVALGEKRATGLWHGVNSGHATWCELAAEATHLVNGACRIKPIPSSQWPQKAARPRNSIMNNSKLTRFLGERPRPWPQALRDYIFSSYLPERSKTE